MNINFVRPYRENGNGGGGGTGSTMKPLSQIIGGNEQIFTPTPVEGLEDDGITVKPGFIRNAMGEVEKDQNYKPVPDPRTGLMPGQQQPGQQQPPPEPKIIEGLNEDGSLKEGYSYDAAAKKVVKDPNYKPPPPEGVNEDGTLQAGYFKSPDGTVAKDPNYVAPEATEEEQAVEFIAAVEAITGIKYEIEYPAGVLPTDPQGVAHRENFIREKAMEDFDNYLSTSDPRSYAYLMHRRAGGNDEDFFGDSRGFQLPSTEELAASADVQASLYKEELMMINQLDPTTAQLIVDAAIKDNTLKDKATLSWNKLDKAQKDQLEELKAAKTDEEKVFRDSLNVLNNSINTTIKSEMGFVVPEAMQPAFQKFVIDNLRYENGKFFVVQPFGTEGIKTAMEALFFQFQKGDLQKIVTKQAKTEAAHRLRLKLKDSKAAPGSGTGDGNVNTKNLPLSSILPTHGITNTHSN